MSKVLYTTEILNSDLISFKNSLSHRSTIFYNFFDTLLNFGFRFNELRNIDLWTKSGSKFYIVPTLKGNNNRVISKSLLSDFVVNQVENKVYLFKDINQSTASYWFHAFYSRILVTHESKSLTTHLFRHNKAKQMKLLGNSDTAIQTYFGEISLENIQNYIYSDLFYDDNL